MLSRITARDRVRHVSERWEKQYPRDTYDHAKHAIGDRLKAIDPETATPADVTAIIGNDSWVTDLCDHCGEWTEDNAYRIGAEPDYESATATLCEPCARDLCRIVLDGAASIPTPKRDWEESDE